MVISLILLFITCMSLSFFEDQMKANDKLLLYVVFGIAMIFIAGMRAVGSTPDTESYQMYFESNSELALLLHEPTFKFFINALQSSPLGVNALFFVYAIISIPIHLALFWKVSKVPLLTLTIYISYYYMMHEMVQIRAGVAAGLFLWAIYFYVKKKKLWTLTFIILGTLFHFSAAAGLVIFLLRDKLPNWERIVLYALVPVGMLVYFSHFDISMLLPDVFGLERLMKYREANEMGAEDDLAGWMFESHPLIWMNIVLYYASIYYHDFLKERFKYTTIAIKVQAVGFCFLFFVNSFSKVVGNRMNDYFSIASILLWTASIYAFYPKLLSKLLSNAISTIRFAASMMAYALALLWMNK